MVVSISIVIFVLGGLGIRSIVVVVSGGNVVVLEIIFIEKVIGGVIFVKDDFCFKLMYYFLCIFGVFGEFYSICKGIVKVDLIIEIDCFFEVDKFNFFMVE